MRKYRLVSTLLGVAAAGTMALAGAAPASAAPAWSSRLPNLGDGTYKCNATHQAVQSGVQGGPLYFQDCTRAVKGGNWQTVTVVSNRSNQVINLTLTIDAVRNKANVGSVTCGGDIRNQAMVACWGKTWTNSSGTIQARNNGAEFFSKGTGGTIQFWSLGTWYSPNQTIVP
jgi:hypothetical protein